MRDILASRPRLRALATRAQPAGQAGHEVEWEAWLRQRLAPRLAAQLQGARRHQSELRVLTGSAVWAARLRYALAELEDQIRRCDPVIRVVRVRVQPPVRMRARSLP